MFVLSVSAEELTTFMKLSLHRLFSLRSMWAMLEPSISIGVTFSSAIKLFYGYSFIGLGEDSLTCIIYLDLWQVAAGNFIFDLKFNPAHLFTPS